jgi:hypothetical protein
MRKRGQGALYPGSSGKSTPKAVERTTWLGRGPTVAIGRDFCWLKTRWARCLGQARCTKFPPRGMFTARCYFPPDVLAPAATALILYINTHPHTVSNFKKKNKKKPTETEWREALDDGARSPRMMDPPTPCPRGSSNRLLVCTDCPR